MHLRVVETSPQDILTEKDLDENVRTVLQLKADAAGACYALGTAISENIAAQLWKFRMEQLESGKLQPRWSSFDAFCKAELLMSAKNAYELADIADRFTEEEVREFGRTNCGLILTAPPEEQEHFQERAREGASTRQLRKEVGAAKQKANYQKPARGGKKVPRNLGKKRTPRATTIAVANIPPKVDVPLFAKKGKRAKGQTLPPEGAFAELQLAPGVLMRFTLKHEASGALALLAKTSRVPA